MSDITHDEMLTTQQAADLLGVKSGTLEVWRATKRYPLPFVKVGAAVRYQKSAVMQFIASRTQAA